MIVRFKLFENENLPQLGEYVIVEPDESRIGLSQEWRDFLKCNVGKIVKIIGKLYFTYKVEFPVGRPKAFDTETLNFRAQEIIEHSKNRKDLEYIEDVNKYNL